MRSRRGFTLVETLAAAAILAAMAAVCVPLVAEAVRAVDAIDPAAPAHDWDGIDLGLLADSVVADPKAFGLDPAAPGEATIEWPGAGDRPPVHLSRLETRGEGGAWMLFRCGKRMAIRWTAIEKPVAPPLDGGAP